MFARIHQRSHLGLVFAFEMEFLLFVLGSGLWCMLYSWAIAPAIELKFRVFFLMHFAFYWTCLQKRVSQKGQRPYHHQIHSHPHQILSYFLLLTRAAAVVEGARLPAGTASVLDLDNRLLNRRFPMLILIRTLANNSGHKSWTLSWAALKRALILSSVTGPSLL